MTKPLTSAAVQKYRPATNGKLRRIPDGGVRSLFLVVHPTGQKSWQMRFRTPGGRIGKLTLGPVYAADEPPGEPTIGMPLTLAGARQLAAGVHRERALGQDPVADAKTRVQRQRSAVALADSNTFAAAAQEYVEKYASKKVRRWKEVARLIGLQPTAEGLSLVPGGLAARWGSRPVTNIDGHDIHTVIAETRERGAPGLQRRGEGPTEARARAMLSALSRMFRWLVEHRRVETNPCVGVHRPAAPRARERVLTDPEIVRFWAATAEVGPVFGSVLRLLLLTGGRLNEIAGLRWEEISEDGTTLNIPGSRTKNHRAHMVPLAPMAQEILASVIRIDGCAYLFSTNGRTPISGWSKCKHALDAAMGNPPPWRIHDLRRTAVTGMADLGIAPHVIELIVNHVSGARAGVAGVYNRSEMKAERRAALTRWAAHVQGLVTGAKDNVVALPLRSKEG